MLHRNGSRRRPPRPRTAPATTPAPWPARASRPCPRSRPPRPPTCPPGWPPPTSSGTRWWPAGATLGAPARGARLRIEDVEGDGCAGLLLHRADRTAERLNVADTVKVQWQAYLGVGLAPALRPGSGAGRHRGGHVRPPRRLVRHEHAGGQRGPLRRRRRWTGSSPNGRDHFAVALLKHGLERRDVAPNINLFKGVRVEPDGVAHLRRRPAAGHPRHPAGRAPAARHRRGRAPTPSTLAPTTTPPGCGSPRGGAHRRPPTIPLAPRPPRRSGPT